MLAELLSFSLLLLLIGNEIKVDNIIRFYGMLLSKLVLFILIIIVSLIIKRNSIIVRFKDYVCLIVTPLISLATIVAITMESDKFSESSWVTTCFIVTGIMIINITVYYLMENIIEATVIREMQSRMETQFEFQEQKYEQTSLSFKKISGIIHDTNKHLLYLRECVLNGEKEEALSYIDKATENIEKSYKRINTGNLVIDALVSNALYTSAANNITFKSDIRIESGRINIERYDLSVTLGNLLDNAVEACKKISNPDDKYIHVSVFTSETALAINIINSKNAGGAKDLKTDKADKLKHGYGLDNVRTVTEKYGGTFSTVSNESSFESTAVLPFCNENDRSGV
jgi:sensor histidine kinase regulating citrate/malate metabolism